jgi:glutathione S-transferase
MPALELVIGTKAWSSWSLRPWLALKATGQKFKETLVPLRATNTAARIRRHTPSGRVPVLKHGKLVIWESLAICEYIAETFPKAGLWPKDKAARALARAVSSEMHSGFAALRQAMSMDINARHPTPELTDALKNDIARITAIWKDCRKRYGKGGPFLFGKFSIADAMYAPVCTRFVTYGVKLDKVSADYVKAIMALPAVQEWAKTA